jgi:glyoxylase I family protein
MINVRNIDHVVIRVRDLATVEAFYRDVLGLPVAKRNTELDLVHLAAGSSMIDLVPVDGVLGRAGGAPPGKDARNMDHLCLRVEPYDEAAILAYLRARDVRIGEVRQRFGAEGDGRSIYCYDPEDNVVELRGPPVATAA